MSPLKMNRKRIPGADPLRKTKRELPRSFQGDDTCGPLSGSGSKKAGQNGCLLPVFPRELCFCRIIY